MDQGYHGTKYASQRVSDGKKSTIKLGTFPSLAPRVNGTQMSIAGERRLDGVEISLDERKYFVGADAVVHVKGNLARVVPDNYSETPEYLAMYLGSLYHIARDVLEPHRDKNELEIKFLMVGLPVNMYESNKERVKAMTKGKFELPPLPGRTEPLVVKVLHSAVLPQPHGSLIAYQRGDDDLTKETLVVFDVGGGTFDWYYFEDGNVHLPKSGALSQGMLACAFAICDALEPGLRNNPAMVKRVDHALQTNQKTIRMDGQDVSIEEHMHLVDAILGGAISLALEKVGHISNIDHFILSGGGGGVLASTLKRTHPKVANRLFVTDEDPYFANVKGFFMQAEMLLKGAR